MSMVMDSERRRQARRQDRGVRRIEAVLDAAEAVFAEAGYEAATTSAIAARAGISPGSLYQFFGGKEALARALGERYVGSLRLLHEAALATVTGVPLETFVSGFVDPIVEFNRAHPALMKLFGASQAPPGLRTVPVGLQQELLDRLERAFAARLPRLGSKRRSRMVIVTLQIGLALLPLTLDADRATAKAFAAELKAAICAYWSAAGDA